MKTVKIFSQKLFEFESQFDFVGQGHQFFELTQDMYDVDDKNRIKV